MDLNQRKLNKSEWTSVEVPVSKNELDILHLIIEGYNNVNIRINKNNSIFMFLKIEYNEKMEDHLYNKYLQPRVSKIELQMHKYNDKYTKMKIESKSQIKSSDKIRLERFTEDVLKQNNLYEFVLLDVIEKLLNAIERKNIQLLNHSYFTLYKLIKNNVMKVNRHIIELTNRVLNQFTENIDRLTIIEHAVEFIEKNENLLKYADLVLYEHQKEIFTVCKQPNPKLVLYIAPTGTGKTLTPIALSEKHRIIFVCAARHVGIALARAAISANKKIAFAFGCSSADDIRLHYFAAKDYSVNKRTGGIGKVDNSVGDLVEIIICDIKSYLPAMYYMLSCNKAENIILYWDEPTITLDYPEHEFHETIKQNWSKNVIPNVVLSSATLPKQNELTETIPDFLNKFKNSMVYNIVSHDCKKSIPIINKEGYVVLPHYLYENYNDMLNAANHCNNYLTLLRYFDLKEVTEFITYIVKRDYITKKQLALNRNFDSLDEINMTNIKIYYIKIMQNIHETNWDRIFQHFKENRKPKILENDKIDEKGNKMLKIKSVGPGITTTKILSGKPINRLASEIIITEASLLKPVGTSGVYVTTKDAYTLTDGPTIFISNDVEKIAKFCIQQANIPSYVMDDISKKIEENNVINEKIHELETNVDFLKEKAEKAAKNEVSSYHMGVTVKGRNKSSKDLKKINRDVGEEKESKGEIYKLTNEVNSLRAMIKMAALNDAFIPNKKLHLQKWADELVRDNAFTSNIDDCVVSDIMALNGVENSWKVLLMMGIGVFINHTNIAYTEIMKRLADEQKLYMIIATSDYIYGTNYQFCHGYLSKDLNLTQEKIIQAMGRIGRNNIQQTYTIRFRDDQQIFKLFTNDTEKPEIINMNKLFNSE
jgi:hypothetical protein